MGLAISVGVLVDLKQGDEEEAEGFRAELARVSALLAARGLPPHSEPESLPPAVQQLTACGSFPYSFLHHLRRAAAHRWLDPDFVATPLAEGVDASRDPAIEEAGSGFDFHLLVHSDCEGYYVPQDFREVLFADDAHPVAGDMLGSSVRLRAELIAVAPALGITLRPGGTLDEEERARLDAIAEDDGPLYRELTTWLALYEAADLSLAHNTLIVFG